MDPHVMLIVFLPALLFESALATLTPSHPMAPHPLPRLHNGHVHVHMRHSHPGGTPLTPPLQVWHMDAYVNLPSGSRPEYHTLTGHTSSVYALVVSERQLISASHDKLVKIWDLNTLRCRHTLKGHNSRVRALALSG